LDTPLATLSLKSARLSFQSIDGLEFFFGGMLQRIT
jgi:hypothetical protein